MCLGPDLTFEQQERADAEQRAIFAHARERLAAGITPGWEPVTAWGLPQWRCRVCQSTFDSRNSAVPPDPGDCDCDCAGDNPAPDSFHGLELVHGPDVPGLTPWEPFGAPAAG